MNIVPVNNTIMNSVTYVLYSDDVDCCILIDCGEYETLKPVLDKIDKRVQTVLLTHGHSDHIYGLLGLLHDNPEVLIGTTVEGHEELQDSRKNLSLYHDNPMQIEGYKTLIVNDGQTFHFDGLADVCVIATPGHDTSCLTYKIGNHLFTGDAYLPGLKTFTKFPGSNKEHALRSIEQLSEMEKQGYVIHCGHHSYM